MGLDRVVYWRIIVKWNTWENYIILHISNLQSIQAHLRVKILSSSYNHCCFVSVYRGTGHLMETPSKNISRDWKYAYSEEFLVLFL